MKRQILCYPDPLLKRTSEEVIEITDELKALADDMVETMYESEGIGLAAPQVGECIRMITVDVSGPEHREELMVLVNPRIVAWDGQVKSEEGCLSVKSLRSEVKRHETVTVEALDLDGNEVSVEADGILAICLQHEIDHLDGKLFIDKLSRLKRAMYDKKVKKWAKEDA